ncbi:hypothetical protein A2X44_04645 [candidate division CPR3 bacterium GWF2_35_18]|uniref:Uncharacterized protein n=1 Tax=candidate division CPR3 bacterium GW2011_GWF2_35_18 TaxID=1618350 RepID=A0A0G0BJX8_UNCC3|nr:MAG: hypothetical protein UR67_C0003G0011 [candidate division CPR3 bacterium GW2011_GWF2_35_18]OGB63623.1 MAG: hypothetical protein A2X44_04645 [candidate division CPR3 bacterium GWF2_35_18]OGB64182.1 MAG: hypothetical protein A2250_02600 [candidate division CPR3 bacterium RIFOXYA2_FULL_35_13]OGB76807.1 MAG: hypothetical protein A2476_04985 [candidate division CPR3 bacterium RIFOXYC2_FULL_35_7]OGB78385.1 MAG: hypothetical protein A2296_02795 [candidate division CPR3 bacterium RIFOXYB2_FULL_3
MKMKKAAIIFFSSIFLGLIILLVSNSLKKVNAEANSWINSGINMYANISGNIGIGTASPQFPLHIAKGTGKAAGFLNEATGTNNDAFVTYKAAINTSGRKAFNLNTGASSLNRLDLRLLNDGLTSSIRTIMTWNYDGNVGIGTTAPAQKLEVNGNFKLSGNIVSDGDICIGNCQ